MMGNDAMPLVAFLPLTMLATLSTMHVEVTLTCQATFQVKVSQSVPGVPGTLQPVLTSELGRVQPLATGLESPDTCGHETQSGAKSAVMSVMSSTCVSCAPTLSVARSA